MVGGKGGAALLTSGYRSLLTSHHRKVIMAMFSSLTSDLNPSQTCMYLVDVHWGIVKRVDANKQPNTLTLKTDRGYKTELK